MIIISDPELHLWSNRFCGHPVVAAQVLEWATQNWKFSDVSDDVRQAIADRFCSSQLPDKNLTAESFLFWTINAVQRFWDVTPLIAGRFFDEKSAEDYIYCAFGDGAIAGPTLKAAVHVTNFMMTMRGRKLFTVDVELENVVRDLDRLALGLTTRAMLKNVADRGLPWKRTPASGKYVYIGHGANRRLFQGPVTDRAGFIGATLARDKYQSLLLLSEIGMPVGSIVLADNVPGAVKAANSIGYPVALKPLDLGVGRHVSARLDNEYEVGSAAEKLAALRLQMIVQSHFPGDDHRILVVDNVFVAAAKRVPASVIGNGKNSISELIEIENKNPRRGVGHYRLMNLIEVDDDLRAFLRSQDLDTHRVPEAGRRIQLRGTANISTGGTAEDVTALVHPDNVRMAETIARQLCLEVAAVDFITPDISKSWKDIHCGLCEVNSNPGLRPHWIANPDHDVTAPIVDLMFPHGQSANIPVAMITGTNGKTTTTLMFKAILEEEGHIVGAATTDGIIIGEDLIWSGDLAGQTGAGVVLTHPDVTAAVLETARGGIIKHGMAISRCDVAALLNIQREQIGIDGVDTLDDMLNVKRKVTDIASDAVVLNADDARTRKLAFSYPKDRVIAFTLDKDEDATKELAEAGIGVMKIGSAGPDEKLVFSSGNRALEIVPIADIPITMKGAHRGNVANAMAAAALAHAMGISFQTIADGLRNYLPPRPDEPGRMFWVDGYPFKVLVDYASNAGSFHVVVEALNNLKIKGKRVCVLAQTGYRPDWSFDEIATEIAPGFDRFICFERPDYLSGRETGDGSERLRRGLIHAGVDETCVDAIVDPDDAMKKAAEIVRSGDFLAVFGGDKALLFEMLYKHFGRPI